MFHTRDISSALHVAALWLLVVSVFFGPAGLGGSAAFASASVAKPCGVSCPCDDAAHDRQPGDHEEHADDDDGAHAGQDDGEPCKDECPDDCPNCGCCLGVAMAVLPLPVTSGATACASARVLSPVDSPANGACTGVFRPPRSLT